MELLLRKTKENNREYAYRVLRYNIMSLQLAPGESLGEIPLAQSLDVSRTPVREAFAALKNENLIHSIPQQSTRVAPIHMQYVREGFLLRRLVEPRIFQQMTGTLDQTLVDEFQINLEQQQHAIVQKDTAQFHALDNEFHSILYLAARKENLWQTRRTVTGHYDRLRYLLLREDVISMAELYQEHQLLFVYLLTGLKNDVETLYDRHFGTYKDHIPILQEKFPHFFSTSQSYPQP